MRLRAGRLACRAGLVASLAWWAVGVSAQGASPEPLHVRIDRLIAQSQPGRPAERASDAEFLRRLSLDLLGTIPSADEAGAFLEDRSADKRDRLIARCLAHPRYAIHMMHVFDVMLLERRTSDAVKEEDWQRYLYESFAANKPYDQLAREILAADGADPKSAAAVKFYLERNGDPNMLTRDVARIFFGRDFQCCQCHDHPSIDHYHQADYYGLYAFLQRGFVTVDKTKPENKDKVAYFAEKADGLASFQSVFDPKKTKHGTRPRLPGGTEIDEPYFAPGDEYKPTNAAAGYAAPKYSRRQRLATETIASNNRAFRRNIVNRLWAQLLGQGLFEPVDLDHPDNPPVNPALLDMLADDFVALHYDIKSFLREVALSDTYQRACDLPAGIDGDAPRAISASRAMEAEQKRLAARSADFEAKLKQAEEALAPLRAASDRVGEQLVKADGTTAAAKKAADAATETLGKAQAELAAKEAALRALQEASLKADAAAKISGVKELATAAAVFRRRSETLVLEVKKLAPAAAKQADAMKAAVKLLENGKAETYPVAARWREANAKFALAEAKVEEATANQRSHLTQINAFKQQLAAAAAVEKYASRLSALKQAERRRQDAEARRTVAQQIVELRRPLVSARLDQLTLAQAAVSDDGPPAASIQAAFQVAASELEGARKGVVQAEAQIEAARADGQAARAAAESELATCSKHWSSRFAAASLKPLTPEQLAWNVMQTLGVVASTRGVVQNELAKKAAGTQSGGGKTSTRTPAAAVRPADLEWSTDLKLKGAVQGFVTLFGGGAGQPQHAFFATVDQALFFANGGEMRNWLAPASGNLADRLQKLQKADDFANELYLAVLTRRPSPEETAEVDRYLAPRSKDRAAAVQEIVWALLTSSEFRFNH